MGYTETEYVRVKICGITNEDDIRVAVNAGADAVGFVTEVPVETNRGLSLEKSRELISKVPPFVSSTVVIMPEDYDHAWEVVAGTEPDVVQIHSGLNPEEVSDLRQETGKKILRKVEPDEEEVSRYAEVVDAVLVDSSGEKGRGGTGETHDWETTRSISNSFEVPVVLAGGLTPTNVGKAVRSVQPYGVDVSSGVEETEGKKDRDLVKSFVRNSREGVERVV